MVRLGPATSLVDCLVLLDGSFGPRAMGPSRSSGYGLTRVETRLHEDACRLEARSRGSTWATGASSASGARGRMARPCASNARDKTSLVTGTAVTTISPGAFSSNSFTTADNTATGRTPLAPGGIGVSSAGNYRCQPGCDLYSGTEKAPPAGLSDGPWRDRTSDLGIKSRSFAGHLP